MQFKSDTAIHPRKVKFECEKENRDRARDTKEEPKIGFLPLSVSFLREGSASDLLVKTLEINSIRDLKLARLEMKLSD